MSAKQKNTQDTTEDFTLWEISAALSVTAEMSNMTVGKARHSDPYPRRSPLWLVVIGGVLLALWGVSLIPSVSNWLASIPGRFELTDSIRILLVACGIGSLLGGIIVMLGDRAYHSLSKTARKGSLTAWCIFLPLSLLAAWVGVLYSLASLFNLEESWNQGVMGVILVLSVTVSSICVMLAGSLSVPLLTTLDTPRQYQSRWSQTAWMLGLTMWTITTVCTLVSLTLFLPENGLTSSMIVLIVTVGVGLLGGILKWHQSNISRLDQQRTELLDALRRALDAFGPQSDGSPMVTSAVRELLEAVTRNPFHSQSIAALPHAASYEVVETVKLIEWAVTPDGEVEFPRSIALRAESHRFNHETFARVQNNTNGREEVKARSRAFIARCYRRLLTGSDHGRTGKI